MGPNEGETSKGHPVIALIWSTVVPSAISIKIKPLECSSEISIELSLFWSRERERLTAWDRRRTRRILWWLCSRIVVWWVAVDIHSKSCAFLWLFERNQHLIAAKDEGWMHCCSKNTGVFHGNNNTRSWWGEIDSSSRTLDHFALWKRELMNSFP